MAEQTIETAWAVALDDDVLSMAGSAAAGTSWASGPLVHLAPERPGGPSEIRDLHRGSSATAHDVELELVGSHVHASGRLHIGPFQRLTDYVNVHAGSLVLTDVALGQDEPDGHWLELRRMRVRLDEVAVIAERTRMSPMLTRPGNPALQVPKHPYRIVATTRDQLLTGHLHLHPEASVDDFVDSDEPRFIPLTDVSLRSLTERSRPVASYPFALVQRRHLLAVGLPD